MRSTSLRVSSGVVRGMAWLAGLLVVATLLASGASAVSLPPEKFGTLDQATTNCPELGCAPTAAVNSFVYLQNMFPEIYGTKLVPTSDGSPTPDEMKTVANDLGANFMGSCTLCVGSPHGTFIEDFILGKTEYIESKAPGRTRYAAQISTPWRETIRDDDGNVVGAHPGAPKPGFVEDRRTPTPEFLIKEIMDREDVEIFIAGLVGEFVPIAHVLTLTGITFSHDTQRGTIQYVDPLGGVRGEANIVGFDRLPTPGTPPQFWPFLIATDYMGGRVDIFHAVSESRIPAPASLVMLGIGLGGVAIGAVIRIRLRPPRSGAGARCRPAA